MNVALNLRVSKAMELVPGLLCCKQFKQLSGSNLKSTGSKSGIENGFQLSSEMLGDSSLCFCVGGGLVSQISYPKMEGTSCEYEFVIVIKYHYNSGESPFM